MGKFILAQTVHTRKMLIMKFSVLITNHNYGQYIEECIHSVLSQSRMPEEIIVIDDGSKDDSIEVLKKFDGVPQVKIVLQENRGQTASWGRGFEMASGDVICILDADDRFKSNYLEELERVYEGNSHIDVVFCQRFFFGEGHLSANSWNAVWLAPEKDYDYGYSALLAYFNGADWIGNVSSTISIRKKLAVRLGLEELAKATNHYPLGGDHVLLWGASVLGGRKYYLHKELIEYRMHGVNNRINLKTGRHKDGFRRQLFQHIAENFFRKRSYITDSAFMLLDEEKTSIPDPLPGHFKAYRRIHWRMKWSRGRVYLRLAWLRGLKRKYFLWRNNIS